VILALCDVQDLRLLEAMRRLPSLVEGEEARIGLGAAGVVAGDAVVEGIAERLGIGREGGPVGIGHGDQPEPLAQPLQSLGGIREGWPA